MPINHVIAWIDHAESHIIHFDRDSSSTAVVKPHASRRHQHVRAGTSGSGHARENQAYFDGIADTLAGKDEILIVGPGLEKLALMKHLLKYHPTVADRVMSVETVDHPSDGQLLQYARKYFIKADLFV